MHLINNIILNLMNRFVNLGVKPFYRFCSQAKKAQMELYLRTPYQTYFEKFTGFSRIITKTQEEALVIQNRMPGAIYVLPPGRIRVKLTQELAHTTGDYMHTGGWLIIHNDNTCEINVMDCFERKDVRMDKMFKGQSKETNDLSGRFISKIKKLANKSFERGLTA